MPADRAEIRDQIKEASDIVDIVGGYISLRQVGPTYKGLCPFHDDNRPSFDVDPRRQRYRCWACSKYGDVISFVQEFERVGYQEALEILARRAGISLESHGLSQQGPTRARMFDVMRWAAEQFRDCLLDGPEGEGARKYLGERKLTGDTVRRFGLGFAPASGDWLVQKAQAAGQTLELLEQVGLIAQRNERPGYYDRFRDRVIFPIREIQGRPVGFGGRVMPGSPIAKGGPKYYNSAETMLFSKSDQLYGIDLAKAAAAKSGYLAIVEGYTDVMMAHQFGIGHVVATMGTALNERHLRKLKHVTQKVVLVFDADAGGNTGVDRALEVFVKNDVDLRIATLPEGLDPCDLLVAQGPEPFVRALEGAVEVFEYKLVQVMRQADGIEGQRRAVEQMLNTLALSSDLSTVKLGLIVNRMAHRLSLKEETLWLRLRELHAAKHRPADNHADRREPAAPAKETPRRTAPAPRHEIDLLELVLGEPTLVAQVQSVLPANQIEHPGLKLVLEGLYRLLAEGLTPDLDHLRGRVDNESLMMKALDLQDHGRALHNKPALLEQVLHRFREIGEKRRKQELQNQMLGSQSHDQGVELLRKLMNQSGDKS